MPEGTVVRRVVDGDTVELSDGQLVRYIGIDAPEVHRREPSGWVMDPEPMAREATEFNRRLVEGRRVQLSYDVQTRDRFGRLLAYVTIDGVMVNEELLREGFAQLLTIPPNVKYAERFRQLAEEARRQSKGLWGAR